MKYEPINGWTKERILEVIRARPFEEPAKVTRDGIKYCAYLSEDGNKCGVGLFIPDGHPGQQLIASVGPLLERHPDLRRVLPFEDDVLVAFQTSHDNTLRNESAKARMLAWVEENVA